MAIYQHTIHLPAYTRGFHLITPVVEREFTDFHQLKVGLLHVFIQHTSASLTINENADPTVRGDFERFFNRAVRENEAYYQHDYEGSDDMPAHLKAAMLGNSVTIPITNGRLNLGTWQGIYLGEHRNQGGRRTLILTAWGE
ncbi:secondary thiamine-phosphate synthase enzyme YjbQ [Spirosoma horti]